MCEKREIREYWGTNKLIETPIFGNLISRDPYERSQRFVSLTILRTITVEKYSQFMTM